MFLFISLYSSLVVHWSYLFNLYLLSFTYLYLSPVSYWSFLFIYIYFNYALILFIYLFI